MVPTTQNRVTFKGAVAEFVWASNGIGIGALGFIKLPFLPVGASAQGEYYTKQSLFPFSGPET
jgi:hypothetical protein